jgi:diguanylate cyclase (GGDEF)-like protein
MEGSEENSETTLLITQGQLSVLNEELKKAKDQEACLIIIRGTPQGQRFFLTKAEMILGRDSGADIVISDNGISRKHVKFTKKDKDVFLSDLQSSNGTLLNDKKVEPHVALLLEKEDMIKVGKTIFKFLPAGELEILFYGNLGLAAHTDPLTKIYNRGYLLEVLEAEAKRVQALHADLSLIFFDLDYFKKVNDTYGHDAGDYVLQEVVATIRTGHLRPQDIFARYGGEEFVILLFNTPLASACELAERIRKAVEKHIFTYETKSFQVTLSIGVASLYPHTQSPQDFLKIADQALYLAKSQGRNQVVFSEKSAHLKNFS